MFGHARVLTHRRAQRAVGSIEWAQAQNCGHQNAVLGWRKQVFSVEHNAKREAFVEVRDVEGDELGPE